MTKKGKIDEKETILNTYALLLEQIKDNEEYISSKEGKLDLVNKKKQLARIKRALDGVGGIKGIEDKKVKRGLEDFQNEINQLEGKDYYFRVDDGFRTYKVKKSTIDKKGEASTVYILNKFKESIRIEYNKTKQDKKIKKLERSKKLDVYSRLMNNVTRNIDLLKRDESYKHDDYFTNQIFNEAYPIFVSVTLNTLKIGD